VNVREVRRLALALPEPYETLKWGKTAYLQVHIAAAKARDVKSLLRAAWERKAPKKLLVQVAP
jgi:hypothetical protein